MTSNFIDYVKINVRSGHGGAGSTHFRREKHVPKGDQTVAMVVVEDILSSKGMPNTGHFST
jgi:hypothetical protein